MSLWKILESVNHFERFAYWYPRTEAVCYHNLFVVELPNCVARRKSVPARLSCLGDRIRVFQHPWTTDVVLWNDVEAAAGVAGVGVVADVAGVDDVVAVAEGD